MQNIKDAFAYLLARFQEASTLRGLVLILTAFGAKISPELSETLVTNGLLVVGLVAILFPDSIKRGKELKKAAQEEGE